MASGATHFLSPQLFPAPSRVPSPLGDVARLSNMHVVLMEPEKIVLEERPIPTLGPNDILVKIMSTGM